MPSNASLIATAATSILTALTIAGASAAPRPDLPPGTPALKDRKSDSPPKSITAGEPSNCTQRVASAFEKQREKGVFSMKARMIDERGVVFMTVDYVLPMKMKQRVKALQAPEAVETILIAERAWSKTGGKWTELKHENADALARQLQETVVQPGNDPLSYECAGTSTFDGKTLEYYTAVHRTVSGKPEANSLMRHVYVAPDSGLPVRNTVTPNDNPNRIVFKADYSYPDNIVIDPPETP